jgi:hypothetical protein
MAHRSSSAHQTAHNVQGSEGTANSVINKNVIQAGELHIDLEKDNFQELLEYDTKELTNMDLTVLELYRMETNVTEEKKEAVRTTRFNTIWLAGGFSMTDKALACFGSQKPNIQKVCYGGGSCSQCYCLLQANIQ